MTRIAVLGGGVMGEALIIGFQRRLSPPPIVVVAEKRAERAAELVDRLGVVIEEPARACSGADVVILVVKPQDIRSLVGDIASSIAPGSLVISIAAGITTELLEASMPLANVVRAMPNTPAKIESGVTGISAGARCSPEALDQARALLLSIGVVVEVPEALQDAVTAVSGSGPAYLFYLAEAMIDGACELGMPPETARTSVVHTLLGAARLLEASGEEPSALRAKVTSPGGTTAAAIRVLDADEVQRSVRAAIEAARDRSRELSQG
jgi:pyrroline-5-carboxylate reductase